MEKLLTVKEAMGILRVSRATITNWQKDGKLPFIKIGGLVRFRESDINEILRGGTT